uniref:SMAX1-like AAA+ ATPase lid domain-containing protein n=1 Tax=Arundo donax TaxID=35708 RepID=A0A0A9F8W2_ARUDO
MIRGCKDASLGKEECHAFLEEKVLAAHGHQLKILVEPGAANFCGGPGRKVVVSSRHSLTDIQASLYSGSVSKRKLNISDGQEKLLESLSTSKRLHRASSVPFDLNLPVDEAEHFDADGESSSHDNSSGNPDGSVENLLRSVDESINFKPFDFGKLCEDMLQELSNTMSDILGPECRMEIDVVAMEQILAAAWASDSERRHVRSWLEQVFAGSLEELKLQCKNVSNSVLRMVTCEDAPPKDDGFGALLPSRIILDW